MRGTVELNKLGDPPISQWPARPWEGRPGLLVATKQQTFDGVSSGSRKLMGFFSPFSDIFETQASFNKIILSCSLAFQIHARNSPK